MFPKELLFLAIRWLLVECLSFEEVLEWKVVWQKVLHRSRWMPPCGPQGFSRKAGGTVWPLVQRLLFTHRKKDRDDKRQSKVEIHSSEWSDYSSMQSQPMRISCLLPYAIRSWPSLIRGYISSRDSSAAQNQALEHICCFHNCCGNCDNYNLFSAHVPPQSNDVHDLRTYNLASCECSWSPLPLQSPSNECWAVRMLIHPDVCYTAPSFDLLLSGWRNMEISMQPQRS